MKTIMYHYVRPKNHPTKVNNYLSLSAFQKQLNFFEKNYGFVTKKELENFFSAGLFPKKKNKIILTFDDGLLDHYKYVYTELKKRNLFGIFYINSKQYETNKLLDVHRIHLLLNRINDNLLLKKINLIVKENMILKKEFKFFKNNTYLNQIKNSKTEIKKILNYKIKPEYREFILDQLFDIFQLKFNLSNFYLNKQQIFTMSKNGMIFGSHTFSHKVLSLLTKAVQEKEILTTDTFINNIHKQAFKTFCIPYGTKRTFDQNTINILNKRKFNFSFAVKSKNITKYDYKNNINNLPRFDCNEFIN